MRVPAYVATQALVLFALIADGKWLSVTGRCCLLGLRLHEICVSRRMLVLL